MHLLLKVCALQVNSLNNTNSTWPTNGQSHNLNNLLTNHFMQQLTVALSKQNTQIQNFRNVKKEIIIDNFSKHSRGDEVVLRELIVSEQSIY